MIKVWNMYEIWSAATSRGSRRDTGCCWRWLLKVNPSLSAPSGSQQLISCFTYHLHVLDAYLYMKCGRLANGTRSGSMGRADIGRWPWSRARNDPAHGLMMINVNGRENPGWGVVIWSGRRSGLPGDPGNQPVQGYSHIQGISLSRDLVCPGIQGSVQGIGLSRNSTCPGIQEISLSRESTCPGIQRISCPGIWSVQGYRESTCLGIQGSCLSRESAGYGSGLSRDTGNQPVRGYSLSSDIGIMPVQGFSLHVQGPVHKPSQVNKNELGDKFSQWNPS